MTEKQDLEMFDIVKWVDLPNGDHDWEITAEGLTEGEIENVLSGIDDDLSFYYVIDESGEELCADDFFTGASGND